MLQKFFKKPRKGAIMTDENKGETEVETQDIQEKYDELLEELTLKDEELTKVK